MNKNAYLEATRSIPAGETRSFRELAALAGKPAAARAAGRAIAICPADDALPWHRVVSADGALASDPDRARVQLERLQREGARPRAGESIARWAKRRHAAWVANWKTRSFAEAADPRVQDWPPDRVERMESSTRAVERGFKPSRDPPRANPRRTKTRDETAAVPQMEVGGGPRLKKVESHSGATKAESRPSLRMEPRSADVAERLEHMDWEIVREQIASHGAFTIERLLDASRCRALRELADARDLFERTIDMAPRGYGIGVYRYFKEPLPEPAFTIREEIYARLLDLARQGRDALEYPSTLAEFFEQCRAAGQRRSSSILLSYSTGGVNHLHRDIYGKLWFPYQAVLVLSAREREFEGGDFLLCTRASDGSENRRALPLDQGDLCLFASRGFKWAAPDELASTDSAGRSRGKTRTAARPSRSEPERRWVEQTHGLSTVTRGARFALGIVLHLAE